MHHARQQELHAQQDLAKDGKTILAGLASATADPGAGYKSDSRYAARLTKHAKHIKRKGAAIAKADKAALVIMPGASSGLDMGWRRRLLVPVAALPPLPSASLSDVPCLAVAAGFGVGLAAGCALVLLVGT
jgi:hypothetical protein